MGEQSGAKPDPPAGRTGGAGRGSQTGVTGAEFAGIGLQFALTILVFVFAGVWLDRRLGTTPWLLLVCVFVGAGGGFYSMYRMVTRRRPTDSGSGGPERRS
jgi:F0F1-type ATP synthase assembly protein I